MADLILKNFTLLDLDELDLVFAWRNTERVRVMMSDTAPITREDHLAFVGRLPQLSDRRYYLAYVGERPLGVIDLTDMTTDGSTCNPGLYTGEGSPMGTGLLLELTVFHGLFDRFGYATAWSMVKKTNADYSEALMRIFKMEKYDEGGDFFKHVFQREGWRELGPGLMSRIFRRFKVGRIVWRDPEGETISYDNGYLIDGERMM